VSPYARSLARVALGWFLAGAVGSLLASGGDYASKGVWLAALGAGVVGVLKGFAARFVGDPDTARLDSRKPR
jgi:hypothetical protein